jgi:hypothetical protein
MQGTLTEGEGSLQLTSLYLPIQIELLVLLTFLLFLQDELPK